MLPAYIGLSPGNKAEGKVVEFYDDVYELTLSRAACKIMNW